MINIIRRSLELFNTTNTLLRINQLTLASFFAAVPILTIIIGILGLTPALKTLETNLFYFIETHLAPGSSAIVTPYLKSFAEQAKKLPIAGSIMLFIAALMLLNSFETTVQVIWKIEKRRNLKDRFLIYWAILTLGPLFVGASLTLYAKVLTLHWQGLDLAKGLSQILGFSNFLLYFALLFVLNFLAPNTQVRAKIAAICALFGTICLMAINYLFSSFTHLFSSYQIIYGAFAAIPILIIWLQLIWGAILISVCLCAVLHLPPSEIETNSPNL